MTLTRQAEATRLRHGWRGFPLHPVLFALAFVLNAYVDSVPHPMAALRVLVGVPLAALILELLAVTIFRDRWRGAVAASLVVLVVLGWRVFAFLAWVLSLVQPIQAAILIALVVLLVLLITRTARRAVRRLGWKAVSSRFDVFSAILLLVVVVSGFMQGAFQAGLRDLLAPSPAFALSDGPAQPDIWVLLLDGHPRADVMERVYGLDPGPLLDGLSERGLEVSQASSSNYPLTPFTLASMLHMRYFDEIPELRPLSEDGANGDVPVRMAINANPVFDALRDRGYEIVSILPPWEHEAMRYADRAIGVGALNEFEQSVLETSAVSVIRGLLVPDLLADLHGDALLEAFDRIDALTKERGQRPRLIFAHIPAPHMPAVFDEDGRRVSTPYKGRFYEDTAAQRGISREEFVRQFRGQMVFLDRLVLDAIGAIQERASRPPIVIVMSDHGSGAGVDWDDVAHSDLGERFANFFAASTPGHPALFGPSITPVNVFAVLLGAYFGESRPLVSDRHYMPDPRSFDLHEVAVRPG